MTDLASLLLRPGRFAITGTPDGYDSQLLAEALRSGRVPAILHVAENDVRMMRMAEVTGFFAPKLEILTFPAWDCLPYDRVSPNGEVVGRRIDTLARLAARVREAPAPLLLVTTVNAVLQHLPPSTLFADSVFRARAGDRIDLAALQEFLGRNGYVRTETVREAGEYALRGGIIDVFPPGAAEPVRLDLFGEELDTIRRFDPLSQRSTGKTADVLLQPVSEILLDETSIQRFRAAYRELAGAAAREDPLYEAVSAGRRFPGMEHWLPLFHERLMTLFDYLPEAAVTLDPQAEAARDARFDVIADHYQARRTPRLAGATGGMPYHALAPDRLYVDRAGWEQALGEQAVGTFSPFQVPPVAGTPGFAGEARRGLSFAEARVQRGVSLFDAVREQIAGEQRAGRRVVVTAYTTGSRDRLVTLLRDHGVATAQAEESWDALSQLPLTAVPVVVLPLETGYTTDRMAMVTEQDILGDRMTRPARRKRQSENFIAEVSALNSGDLVVHREHGIGRYDGLVTLEVGGAPHDCLRIVYDGDAKLFVPVESLDVLSRFGSEETAVQLGRLGGAAWQARKAKVKQRIRDIAEHLIRVAAERLLKTTAPLVAPQGAYDEFCARFPFPETEDQLKAINDVLDDLASGRATDRLVCGDVGFGKTEVALRAAFVAAMAGMQVAVVVPTTLLARQHYRNFVQRFEGLPLRIAQLSRLVTAKEAAQTRKELAEGQVDIVVGTHSVLAKSISFRDLGLLIVDEEQHFGVSQKERLKQFKSNVHVLTLTATPIPRTLQLALSGVREMSLIATPPVDRLAVRTFVTPFDPVTIREAILREHFRGGQVFVVCPRIEDLPKMEEQLAKLVPEIKMVTAHGRLAPTDLEKVISAFYDHEYDLLLSTNIVEAGLDLPTANTIILHRADMFGLAQLYQLRGRVGRSKIRAYCYYTLPPDRKLTPLAQRRLEVMQTLDSLGAGFSLASHDMDIRGAGNLLGDEQSGHIKEVGVELYQHMLEEAVATAKAEHQGDVDMPAQDDWTPQIAVGNPVLIPERYVQDLGVRLSLYQRIAHVVDQREIDAFAAELVDRFGPLPSEVDNLLQIVAIKQLCWRAGVEKVDAGPKGAVVAFRESAFRDPGKLVTFIARQAGTVRLRPDQKLVYRRAWDDPAQRLAGLKRLMRDLAELAA